MEASAYEAILAKHAELTGIVTKCATENRAPSPEEKTRLDALKGEIDAIKAEWESTGRKAFLESLAPPTKPEGAQVVLKAADSLAKHLEGSYDAELKGASLGKILRGYVLGDWDDAGLERKAMASSPTSAGGIMIPTPLAGTVLDLARNQARILQAGAITVPMTTATLRYARLTQDVTAGWTSEGANIALSQAAFDSVLFTAHKLAVLVVVDNELLEDAPNTDAEIEKSISKQLALALDLAGLYGTGTPPQPQGIHGQIPAVASGGTLTNYDKFLNAIADVRAANWEPNAVIYSSRTADTLARLKAGVSATDQRQLPPPAEWEALSKYVTNQVANNLGSGTNESQAFVGQWDQLALGLRSSLQIEVSRDAGYYDGSAQQSAFSKDQTVLRAILRADWQLLHSSAFAEVTGILAS